MEIGIRQLRDGLSRFLQRVKAGEEITITEHGRPIARIVPAASRSTLDELIELGIVTPPKRPKQPIDPSRLLPIEGWSLSDIVIEQREEEHADLLRHIGVREDPPE